MINIVAIINSSFISKQKIDNINIKISETTTKNKDLSTILITAWFPFPPLLLVFPLNT